MNADGSVLISHEKRLLIAAMAQENRDLRRAIKWVLDDARYKAPEQLNDVSRRWIARLQEVVR